MHRVNTLNVREDRLIYLVDDEEPLLDLAEVSLCNEGYELKRFQDPTEAFESFTLATRKPSLLLTDYAMESMNGMELSAKCKSAYPALKILMVSGTASADVVKDAPGTVDSFMPKPYKPADLAQKVRSLLATV